MSTTPAEIVNRDNSRIDKVGKQEYTGLIKYCIYCNVNKYIDW